MRSDVVCGATLYVQANLPRTHSVATHARLTIPLEKLNSFYTAAIYPQARCVAALHSFRTGATIDGLMLALT